LSEFSYDRWEKPPHVRDAFERIERTAERGPEKPELTRSYELPGKPMTAAEFAEFRRKGRKINYGEARMAKQLLNDQRHEERQKRHPLIDIVIDVVASWDSSDYLEQRRRSVRIILAKSSNERRRKLAGMSTKQRRHQQSIRLVRALAFDGITQAEYCRRHKLDPADASRMLAHLCDKEPGLADAIDAISACAKLVSRQNRQQTQKFRNKREGVRIVYGHDYQGVEDEGWLSEVPNSGIRSYRTGRFKPISTKHGDLIDSKWWTLKWNPPKEPQILVQEPFRPFDLHKPETWRELEFAAVDWNALHEPLRAVERYDVPLCDGLFDRYREISRKVLLKNGKSVTFKPIARAIPISDWDTRPLGYHPQLWYPAPDIWVGWKPTQARYECLAAADGYIPEPTPRSATARLTFINGRWCRVERALHERKWTNGVMCNPVRRWESPLDIKPHGSIKPFTRRNWISYPVKDTELLMTKQTEFGLPLYYVRKVT
jgi:hypothetical protein